MADEFKILGLKGLQDALKQLPAKVEFRVMRTAMAAGARVLRDEAKARVPVDTGKLKRSIRVSTRAKGNEVTATVTAGRNAKPGDPYYAHMIEFGTRKMTDKQAFMRPTLDEKGEAAVEAFADKARKLLDIEVKKLATGASKR